MEEVERNASERDELLRILEARLVVSRYQPIIDLRSGDVAGFEALARGPQHSALEFPDRLFAVAEEVGELDRLDGLCRVAAITGAAGSLISRDGCTLFVNTEPGASAASMVDTFEAITGPAHTQRLVFEITERALTDRPADVLAAVTELRRLGAGIALDDVGVDPRSLALLAFVRPDVVKLDMSIVQGPLTARNARVMHAVGAFAEATGASIIAEGIETPDHLAVARSLGATHGQGWLFGKPQAPPEHLERLAPFPAWTRPSSPQDGTPYQMLVRSGGPVHQGDKALIYALSRQLEVHAATLGEECVVLGNLQHVKRLTPATAARYSHLADLTAFAGLIGTGVPDTPAPGARGGTYHADHPLAQEWSVVVISPHFAGAMLAIDLGDEGIPDMARRFSFCLTYDRNLVAAAARALMTEITSR